MFGSKDWLRPRSVTALVRYDPGAGSQGTAAGGEDADATGLL